MFQTTDSSISARYNGEILLLEPVGENGCRVRITRNARLESDRPSALLLDLPQGAPRVEADDRYARLTNGRTCAELRMVARGMGPALELRFTDAATGRELLVEEMPHILWPGTHHWKSQGGALWSLENRFAA